jgi:hypothetical protein
MEAVEQAGVVLGQVKKAPLGCFLGAFPIQKRRNAHMEAVIR